MDSQDYLNQISAEARPAKNNTGLMKIVTSKYFMWGMIALAALIVMMIFGSIMGSNKKPSLEVECYTLNLHLSSNVELIDTYQPNVKSSKLRSLSASLKGVFSNTSSQLTDYMEQAFKIDEKKLANYAEEAELNKEALNEDLFAAKINGLLDRTYAHKMALEIYTIIGNETGIIDTTKDDDLKSILKNSQTSLENLYNEFNNFSETET